MTHAANIAREQALTDALREADQAIGLEQPTPQALRIIKAIKRLRDMQQATVRSLTPVDYLGLAQKAARSIWMKQHAIVGVSLPINEVTASIDTPIGKLTATVWRTNWTGKRGNREVWAGSYMLNGKPINMREIKAAGLAQRPTTRNRQRKDAPK